MKLKSLLLTGIGVSLCASSAFAIPAKRDVRNVSQPDGSTLSLQLIGDEYFHSLATPDGLAVKKAADGFFHYVNENGELGDRVDAGVATQSNNNRVSVQALAASRKNEIAKARARRSPSKLAGQSQVPTSGSPRVPVLLVQYSDYKFKDQDPNKTFTEFFSTGAVSAHQYFVDQSNGKYTPQFDVYGPVTLPNKREYYGGNDWWGNDQAVGEMVAVGCQNLDSQIDFTKYDNDGDKECDVVIVLYAGDGEASSFDDDAENSVWPCQWELSDSDYGKSLTLDGIKVDKFAVFNELYGADLTKIDGIGTFCHEFSHCLDLPDYYDTEYGPHFGMGPWSLMDYGSYNNDGFTPIGYNAYEKAFMGWIDIEEGTENTLYTLPVFNQKNAATDKAVKLTNPADKNEYFILENRKKQGWDAYMPTDGLFIYHITYSEDAWTSNVVNNYDLQRITPVPADGTLKMNKTTYYGETYYEIDETDLLGDLWPYGNATELTDDSTPAVKVNTGSKLGKPITEITRNADGTISFWCMKAPKPALSTPTGLRHILNSSTSATIYWDEAQENTPVSYTLEVKPYRENTSELVNSTVFSSNDHDWETDGYAQVEKGSENLGIRLGSNKQDGIIESPYFTTDDSGVVTVKFNAAQYNNDSATLYIDLADQSFNLLDEQSVKLSKDYQDYTVVLQGEPNATTSVVLSADAKKRAYIKSVDIYTGDASESSNAPARVSAKASAAKANDAILIEGILGSSYTVSDLEANGKYTYRLRKYPVVAAGEEAENDPSAWTEKLQLDLSDTTGIENIPTITGAADGEVTYYTLQGIRLNERPSVPGIYIVASGNTTAKLIVR